MYKNKKLLRYVSAFIALTLFFNIAAPVSAFALTGGPSQPEVESFEPVSTTQMVNPFTGDFTYNIPLLTVPGPNGGYPLNMAYHAGVGMEQEASWVGLGWNINVGSINRIVRGLPDDFKGDDIKKTLCMKQSVTVGLDARTAKSFFGEKEFFGAQPFDGVSGQIFFNNFKGVGYKISATLGSGIDQDASSSPFSPGLSLSYSTDGGLGVSPSISYLGIHKHKGHFYELGFGFNSREGLTGIRFNVKKGAWSLQESETQGAPPGTKTYNTVYNRTNDNRGAGANYAAGTFIPFPNAEQAGTIVHLGIKAGKAEKGILSKKWPLTASVAVMFLTNRSRNGFNYDGYGYMYQDARTDPSFSNDPLMDYNLEKDVPVTKNSPVLPIPVFTSDIYTLSGQGIGGVFVPHRSDYGILYEDRLDNSVAGGNLNFEVGVSAAGDFKVGSDWGINVSHSYNGGWENPQTNAPANYEYFRSQDDNLNDALYEPFYFEGTGEMGASNQDYSNIGGDDPVNFKMGLSFQLRSFTPKTEGELRNSHFSSDDLLQLGNNVRPRERRSQHIAYRTNEMITSDGNYADRIYQIYAHNNFPSNTPSADGGFAKQIDYTRYSSQGHHIGEITVTNPDGNRYVYGLPALNTKQSESVFSVNSGISSSLSNPEKIYTYTDGNENSKDNNKGEDNFYSKTETPTYAYSYLLTAVYSADYVDLTGDGPTDDDLGYYIKFNYSAGSTHWPDPDVYKWRVPYHEASAIEGHISNFKDDKATYTYGEKEVYYLNSVETKTHIAEFHLNAGEGAQVREDGVGANDEANTASMSTNQNSRQLFYLRYIELFSKNDRSNPIKKVHFEYNYELCPGIDNSFVSGHGKLTLKKIWFTHLGNGKGQLNPYEFDYDVSTFNPSYDLTTMDRWGNYQVDITGTKYNIENPYVVQQTDYDQNGTITHSDATLRDKTAGAWCLKKIKLPSGGEINVTYESDDYSHVQDKPALEMVKITAVGNGTTTNNELKKDHLRVYFELDEPISTSDPDASAKLQAYASGLDVVYFKTFQKLKKFPNTFDYAYDYVDGYATLANSTVTGVATSGVYNSAYIELRSEHRFDLTSTGQVHPFKKAGWQYLRMSRPDLFDSNDPVESSFTNVVNACTVVIPVGKMIIKELPRLLNYYTYCELHNFCEELNLSANRPSYIRLLNPVHRKYGGGHRVKKITINDKWDDMVSGETDRDYGQEFQYVMPDGSSSGVAEYEPLVGGEEIPQHLPLRYNSDHLLSRDEALFLETPFGESFYPAANVGYRRVIVRNLQRLDGDGDPVNAKTSGGITVNEFYTAKEFPVFSDFTEIQHKPYKLGFFIPCVGWQSFNNHGYSQGFRVQLNDMHGRPKSVATYKGGADIDNVNTQPVSKVEYKYKVKGNYNPDGANYLDSRVTVLDQDGSYRDVEIGKNIDFYTEMREHSNQTINTGMSPDVDVIPGFAVPDLFFFANYSESYFRSAVSVKVIRQNGVLDETVVYSEGATAHNKNLMFDAETGEPILTSTYNDFEKPIYSYSYPAWWAYDNMGGEWSNWNAHFFHMDCTSGIVDFPNASSNYANPAQYFKVGDKIGLITRTSDVITGITPYWVDQINDDPTSTASDNIHLIDEDNLTSINFSDAEFVILESGRSNQLLAKNGALVSLKNPVTERTFTLLSHYNAVAPGYASGNGFTPFSLTSGNAYTDCATGNSYDLDVTLTSDQILEFVKYPSGQSPNPSNSCSVQIIFDLPFGGDLSGITAYTLERRGSTVVALDGSNNIVNTGKWIDPDNCLPQCMDGVLQASAVEFKDAWSYNYEDAGTPDYKTIGMGSPATLLSSTSVNPYRFGQKNVWRNYRSFAYQVKRNQTNPTDPTQTDIAADGTFENYTFYNWSSGNNPYWTFTSEATRYNPYGYQVESKDALGIYSSALYGYNNSTMTAMSSNTSYFEQAFDGFEDYPSNTYTADGHGHLLFTAVSSSTVALSTDAAHTGKVSYLVSGPSAQAQYTCTVGNTPTTYFMPTQLKDYHFSVWVKPVDGADPEVVINSTPYGIPSGQSPIEGWYRIEGDLTAPSNTSTLDIRLSVNGALGTAEAYFDDFRLQPFQSSMITYVYDPVTLWLVAQLDDRNFATFYNYDEEGSLVQVKKETERGVMTIKTSRNNLQRN